MTKTENHTPERFPGGEEVKSAAPAAPARPAKKAFVEPEVSFPIDVLEATTFFIPTESGAVNSNTP